MTSSRKEDLRVKDIPDVVVDPSTGKRYMKGKFLGKVCQNTLDQIHL